MKKSVDIATLLCAPWAVITGILDSDIHILVSAIFTIFICIHAFLYRKVVINCFKGLRWEWGLSVLVCLVIIFALILD
jgi:hypothetical protein